jgi:hypothetical protein
MFTIRKNPPALTPGKYHGKIVDVKSTDGQYGQRLIWTVDIEKGGHTYRAQGYTDTTFYEGSMECRWASAIIGTGLDADDQIDEAELIGAPVTVQIAVRPGRDGLKMFYNVQDIQPPASGEESEPTTPATSSKAGEDDVPF